MVPVPFNSILSSDESLYESLLLQIPWQLGSVFRYPVELTHSKTTTAEGFLLEHKGNLDVPIMSGFNGLLSQ